MSSEDDTFIIVGGGQAGAWLARTLRAEGFQGRVVLISEERHWPYERPPLSKGFQDGTSAPDSFTLLTAQFAIAERIEFWPATQVSRIDRSKRTVTCSDERSLNYTKLFLVTGGRPKMLPGMQAECPARMHVLRTQDDALRLRAALKESRHLLVIGGGWIGLEAAATARLSGVSVTILEAGSRLCARTVPTIVSDYLLAMHQRNGVTVKTSAALSTLRVGESGVVAQLAGGETVAADHVLVGIGISPNTGIAAACGIEVRNGIVVDKQGRTSDPDIFAAGDVALHPSDFAGEEIRLESWANAQSQAICAARAALGKDDLHTEIPWFWSDQYATNLQCLGLPHRAAHAVARGDPQAGNGCWLFQTPCGRLAGATAINAPREMRMLRKAFAQGCMPDLVAWADNARPLTSLPMIPLSETPTEKDMQWAAV
ncbi:Ferredoxin--NAD+ reductase [Paraburkholderia piptadeniae]|uniref:Ferredoxin--NAD+ reductase n=2 Tax=Paraburkholderia piptadeniae TaxID=1701573 RepID=A0A1N7RIK7_9BURK|nr:Ferredoxin--NAD+ reductase [Paraburkholderia piptadeniae]